MKKANPFAKGAKKGGTKNAPNPYAKGAAKPAAKGKMPFKPFGKK